MTDQRSIVDQLHLDFQDALKFFDAANEVSLRSVIEENCRKALLLCAASFFERQLCLCVERYAMEIAGEDSPLAGR